MSDSRPFYRSPVSLAVAALFGAVGAHADTALLIKPATAVLTIDMQAFRATNASYWDSTVSPVGQAVWNSTAGTLTLPVQSVEVAQSPGAASVKLGPGNGFVMHTQWGDLTVSNIYFSMASGKLVADICGTAYLLSGIHSSSGCDAAVPLKDGKNAGGSLGSDSLTAVSTSATARDLAFNSQALTAPASTQTNLQVYLRIGSRNS